MRSGLLISLDDVTKDTVFDSDNPRLQVGLGRDPKHLDIIYGQATPLVTNAGNGFFASETFLSMKHNLGYTPKVLIYFYSPVDNSYNSGEYIYFSGAFKDLFTYSVSDTMFSIQHVLDDTAFQFGETSGAAAAGQMQIKYMICSNPINNLTLQSQR